MSLAVKRCACDPARWVRCAHPWYGTPRRVRDNLTRYAREVLNAPITTKTEAEDLVRAILTAKRAGAFVTAKAYTPPAPAVPAPVVETGITLARLAALFTDRILNTDTQKTANSKANDRAILTRLTAQLGPRPAASLDVEDLIAWRAALPPFANSTWAKYRTVLGQLFRWAKWAGHLAADPLATAPPDLLKRLGRTKAAQRRRRIDADEWANLLEAAQDTRTADAATRLSGILVALLETGARIGELLALHWADVDLVRKTLHIAAAEEGGRKTGRARTLDLPRPLAEILEALARTGDPAGRPWPRTAYVFGDPYGERLTSVRKAWDTAVLRAHGLEPRWTAKGALRPASRAALARLDLHLHDIRHEAACRWLESGHFDLAQISAKLGHTTIAQTATYLHTTIASTRAAQAAYDEGRPTPQMPARSTRRRKSDHKAITNNKMARAAARALRLVKKDKANNM